MLQLVGVGGLDRRGYVVGHCLTRVHSYRCRGGQLLFHGGVGEVNRCRTFRVSGALGCRGESIAAPLNMTRIGFPASGVIVNAVFHTNLPFRRNFLGVFSRSNGTFIDTCHRCAGGRRARIKIRVRCLTAPSLANGALVVTSPVLTANVDVRVNVGTLLAGKAPGRVRMTYILTTPRNVRRIGGAFPRSGAAV